MYGPIEGSTNEIRDHVLSSPDDPQRNVATAKDRLLAFEFQALDFSIQIQIRARTGGRKLLLDRNRWSAPSQNVQM